MTKDQIEQLPNNYTTQPLSDAGEPIRVANRLELPEDLFKQDGPWLQVVYWSNDRIAVVHEASREHRSESLLFLRLPSGRDEGLKFVESFNKRARQVARPLLPDVGVAAKEPTGPAPAIPSGTQTLLLSRMLAITPSGELASTPLIESIEVNEATSMVNPKSGVGLPMKSAAFRLSYPRLLRAPQKTSLRRVGATEPLMGADFIPGGLSQCVQCHTATTSVLSFYRYGISAHAERPIDLSLKVVPNGSSPPTRYLKSNTVGHGLLQGIIEAVPSGF